MKNFISFSIAGVACILAFFLFSGLECNDSGDPPGITPEPEKCGQKIVDRKWFEEFNAEDLKKRCTFNQENSIATFSFSAPSQENVCPHEHLNITIEVIVKKSAERAWLILEADIMYGIFFNYPITNDAWEYRSDANYDYSKTTVNFGIKSSFGDDPGWYRVFLDFGITFQSNCEESAISFSEQVYMIKIDWEHYEYKEP